MKRSKLDIMVLFKMILLLTSVFYSGCASIALSTWNDDFEAAHQRSIEFASASVPAEYLGKVDDAYVYRLLDAKSQEIIFRLPAKNNRSVVIELHGHASSLDGGKMAMFHFNNKKQLMDKDSEYPQNVDVFTSSIMSSFSYACKEGEFFNDTDKSVKQGIGCRSGVHNCHGLSVGDSMILGVRNAGYLIAIPLDIASFPVTLPLGIIFLSNYCGPFGCP